MFLFQKMVNLKIFFGKDDPMGKIIKVNNKLDVKVNGIYEDIPEGNYFKELK